MHVHPWAGVELGDPEEYDGCVPDPRRRWEQTETIASPWLRGVRWAALTLVAAGILLGGWAGFIGTLGTVLVAMFAMPEWTSNNAIERSEAAWIARNLQTWHDAHKATAEREKSAIQAFENPPRWLITARRVSAVLAVVGLLGVVAGIVLKIFGLGGLQLGLAPVLLVPLAVVYVHWRRCWNRLDAMAEERRGGVRTETLRDVALSIRAWPHRLAAFLVSTLLVAVAPLIDQLTRAEPPLLLLGEGLRLFVDEITEQVTRYL